MGPHYSGENGIPIFTGSPKFYDTGSLFFSYCFVMRRLRAPRYTVCVIYTVMTIILFYYIIILSLHRVRGRPQAISGCGPVDFKVGDLASRKPRPQIVWLSKTHDNTGDSKVLGGGGCCTSQFLEYNMRRRVLHQSWRRVIFKYTGGGGYGAALVSLQFEGASF